MRRYDLLIARGELEAEIACDVVSAEEGRLVHRGAWSRLADRVDADLRAWLAAYPGRYLLKMTLPQGLRDAATLATTARAASAVCWRPAAAAITTMRRCCGLIRWCWPGTTRTPA